MGYDPFAEILNDADSKELREREAAIEVARTAVETAMAVLVSRYFDLGQHELFDLFADLVSGESEETLYQRYLARQARLKKESVCGRS